MNGELLIWDILSLIILLSDIVFIIIVVFFERKNPSATLAWVMALFFLPVVGFILYLFLGQTYSKEKMFRIKKEEDQRLQDLIRIAGGGTQGGEHPCPGSVTGSPRRCEGWS